MTRRISTIAATIVLMAASALPATASDAGPDTAPSPALPSASPPMLQDVQSIDLAEPFVLKLLSTAVLEDGLVIRFEAVTEDSRCPADVVCVWEGNAAIALLVDTSSGASATLTLDTNPGFRTAVSHGHYAIRLLGLDPYPRADVETPGPYHATLVVTRPGPGLGPGPEETHAPPA